MSHEAEVTLLSYNVMVFVCFFCQVDWGEATMIEAERILLRHALEDPHNKRFIFLSDRYLGKAFFICCQMRCCLGC